MNELCECGSGDRCVVFFSATDQDGVVLDRVGCCAACLKCERPTVERLGLSLGNAVYGAGAGN